MTMVSPQEAVIEAHGIHLRDPAVLLHDGTYYMYGTGWQVSTSTDLAGPWSEPVTLDVELPADDDGKHWAPEVHAYNGAFYMFTTYQSSKSGRRGCVVFRAEHPMGPFKKHSDGHLTPSQWDAIDGTLYVDELGQPWMVFVHEWVSTVDGVGTMACAKLSKDLKTFVSEPIELFRADSPAWSQARITDGCWMYRLASGELIMLWSNWDEGGYCVGTARSESGEVTGLWVQGERLFTKGSLGEYDGGHAMIFTDKNGKLWMSLHSPNNAADGRPETPIFVPLRETGNTLMWDLEKRA